MTKLEALAKKNRWMCVCMCVCGLPWFATKWYHFSILLLRYCIKPRIVNSEEGKMYTEYIGMGSPKLIKIASKRMEVTSPTYWKLGYVWFEISPVLVEGNMFVRENHDSLIFPMVSCQTSPESIVIISPSTPWDPICPRFSHRKQSFFTGSQVEGAQIGSGRWLGAGAHSGGHRRHSGTDWGTGALERGRKSGFVGIAHVDNNNSIQ